MSEVTQTPTTVKPVKAKPVFYACCYEPLKLIAKDKGYNLLINGSLSRDMDLVAIPWINEPADHMDLIQEFDRFLNGVFCEDKRHYLYSILPGGRHSYVINLNRGGKWNQYEDLQWYVDVSITPLIIDNANNIKNPTGAN